jgi:hypothetical protein
MLPSGVVPENGGYYYYRGDFYGTRASLAAAVAVMLPR